MGRDTNLNEYDSILLLLAIEDGSITLITLYRYRWKLTSD